MLSIIYDNIFNLAIKILSVAELFVVVAVCTQDDEKNSPYYSQISLCRTVKIASTDFLLAEVALSDCQVLSSFKFRLAKGTTSSMDGRN